MVSQVIQSRLLADALFRLRRIDELRRLAFGFGPSMAWEPPMDLIQTATELVAYVALPGVDPASVEIEVESGMLVLRGQRAQPPELSEAAILQLELPWGQFERRVPIPDAVFSVTREPGPGCLVIRLTRVEPQP